MAVTKEQMRILEMLEVKSPQHRDKLLARVKVLERMVDAGLIVSAQPFAFAFHTVSITEAGRAALAESKGRVTCGRPLN